MSFEGMLANALRQLATFKLLPYSLAWQIGLGKSLVLFIMFVLISVTTLSNGNLDGTKTAEDKLLVWDSRGGRLRGRSGPAVTLTTEPKKDNSKVLIEGERMNIVRVEDF